VYGGRLNLVVFGVIDMTEHNKTSAERRLFLEKAGRFAVVTPPTVALMLSAAGVNRAQAQSAGTASTTLTEATAEA